ncbi:Plug domain-containing protein [Pseudomonas sp. CrR25]|nr:Plug domain-containing protein [Pseudomonas sp. CrR25]
MAATDHSQPAIDIKDTRFVELMTLEVTPLSRKVEALSKAPTAVYVLAQDHIRRIGGSPIVGALRHAPGVEVDRQEANEWAIIFRGLTSRMTTQLLVMIDGRRIFSLLLSVGLREEKDVVLEDVERIDAICGPGDTTEGVNALEPDLALCQTREV